MNIICLHITPENCSFASESISLYFNNTTMDTNSISGATALPLTDKVTWTSSSSEQEAPEGE